MWDHLSRPFEGPFEGFTRINPSDVVLLCPGSALESALEARCSNLRIATSPLKNICAHNALIILRSSFSVPKLMHILRCSPCAGHYLLEIHEGLLRDGISLFTDSWATSNVSMLVFHFGRAVRGSDVHLRWYFLPFLLPLRALLVFRISSSQHARPMLTTRFAQHAAAGLPLMTSRVHPINPLSASAPGTHLALLESRTQFGMVHLASLMTPTSSIVSAICSGEVQDGAHRTVAFHTIVRHPGGGDRRRLRKSSIRCS